MKVENTHIQLESNSSKRNVTLAVDVSKVASPVLMRLIEEVRHDHENNVTAYDRVHNRHNR